MKRRNLMVLMVIVAGLFSSCSKAVYENLWQSKVINADGSAQEWQKPLRYFDDKSKLQYTVTNDAQNLYVCICATDEQSQMKIMRAGMQFWIDTTGRDKQQVGILYPLPSNDFKRASAGDSIQSKYKSFQKNSTKSNKGRYGMAPQEMQLVGFKAPIGGLTLLKNDYGIVVNMDWDKIGIMTYEAIIPFKTFYKNSLSAADNSKIFTVNIIVPAISGSSRPGGSETRGGGMGNMRGGGNRGGGMGGGMRGGGQRGGGNERSFEGQGGLNTMREASKITMRIKLAPVQE